MFGRCQQTLYRGVLTGLQHQQQCLQLEVLGLQGVRHINDWKLASRPVKKAREIQRKTAVIRKVLDEIKSKPAGGSSNGLPATASSTAAAAAAESATSSSSTSSSGPVASPLSAQMPVSTSSSSSSSSTSTSLVDASSPAAKDDKAGSWAPEWLNKIMDFPLRRRRSAPSPQGVASPLQKDAPDADSAAKEGEDGWEHLEKFANMTLDDYKSRIKDDPGLDAAAMAGSVVPRPNKPPNLGPRGYYSQRLDYERIRHARFAMHVTLIGMMTEGDKKRVYADPAAALKDDEFIGRIATISLSRHDEVRDVIHEYKRRRDQAAALQEFRAAGKELPPNTDDVEVSALCLELRGKRLQKEVKGVLAARDPANCQLKVWASVVGANRTCPKTKLPYKECCGSLKSGKKALRR